MYAEIVNEVTCMHVEIVNEVTCMWK